MRPRKDLLVQKVDKGKNHTRPVYSHTLYVRLLLGGGGLNLNEMETKAAQLTTCACTHKLSNHNFF